MKYVEAKVNKRHAKGLTQRRVKIEAGCSCRANENDDGCQTIENFDMLSFKKNISLDTF